MEENNIGNIRQEKITPSELQQASLNIITCCIIQGIIKRSSDYRETHFIYVFVIHKASIIFEQKALTYDVNFTYVTFI